MNTKAKSKNSNVSTMRNQFCECLTVKYTSLSHTVLSQVCVLLPHFLNRAPCSQTCFIWERVPWNGYVVLCEGQIGLLPTRTTSFPHLTSGKS